MVRHRIRLYLSILGTSLCLALLAACAGPRAATTPRPDLPSAFPNHSVSQILYNLQEGTESLQTYHARGRAVVRSPDGGGSFNVEIFHERNGRLFMSISPGLGITAVRALVTPDSFFVYNRIENTLTYGSRRYAAANLPIALPDDDLFPTFLGLLAPEAAADWSLSADSSLYVLSSADRRYTIDPSIWRVVRYERGGRREAPVEIRSYSSFDLIESHYLAREFQMRQPNSETIFQIHYGRMNLAPEEMRFDLGLRASTERIAVGRSGRR